MANSVTTTMRAQVSQLYVAMFGRAPDGEGMGFWTQQMANGQSMTSVANTMYATSPARSFYPDFLTNSEIIGRFYTNVLGRTADTDGLNYWTAKLNAAGATPGAVISEMIGVVAGYNGTDPAGLTSQALFNNKAAVAQHYGEANLGVNDATTILSTVTSVTATVTAANAAIDAIAAGSAGAFTLTNGTDVATASVFTAGQVYTPGGDDRINSLQDEDQLTGTAGTTDRIDATLGNANDNGATIITPKLNGIEVINVAFTGSGATAATALDLQDATGQTEVNITRISQASNTAEVGNIMTAAATLTLANTNANNAGVAEFSYGAGVLSGLNTGTLGVSNVQVGIVNIGQNTSGIAARGVATTSFENLTLTSSGAATNTIGTLNLPMDTGVAGVLNIAGSANLVLGAQANIVNNLNAALIEAAGVYTAATGLAQAGGRLNAINAATYTGNLTLVLDNLLDVGQADTSGVVQNVTITGGTGNDTFVLYDAVQAGDSINGGNGNDTLLFYSGSSLASVVTSVEAGQMLADGSTGNIALDFDFLPNATSMNMRNISAAAGVNAAEAAVTFSLTDMTAAQAAALSVQHSTTFNGQIANTIVEAAVKTNTAADLLGITIAEGTNVDPVFNFTIDTVVANTATATTASASTFESVTITDTDSESNSVELQNFAQHTGTITLTGGVAGKYINLDVDTAGADVTAVTTGATADGGQVQQGLLGLDTDGTSVNYTAGNFWDAGVLATEVRLGAATINAANEASNVYLRVGTNAASVTGAQSITTGSGNDVVIFDLLNDSRAGLTISDTVVGGTGTDTLALDGNGVIVSLGASEWTNVSGFEIIRLVGNGVAAGGTILGTNSYNLVLTNELIAANGGGVAMITVANDNDISNDTASGANTASTGAESGVTLDARTLNASSHFTYNGEEGASNTVDKFILADANINGANIIDGGAVNNVVLGAAVNNTDVLEIRNAATATVGDLANIRNVGIIAGTNDQATAQTLTLELNDTVIDLLADSYHVSTAAEIETVAVRINNAADITAAIATVNLNLDVSALTAKSGVTATLYGNGAAAYATGLDNITLGTSATNVVINNFQSTADAAGFAIAAGAHDELVLSLSKFTLIDAALGGTGASVVGAALAAGDFNGTTGGISASTSVIAQEIVFDNTSGALYYNTDGATAGGLVLIATLTGVTDLAVGDFTIIG